MEKTMEKTMKKTVIWFFIALLIFISLIIVFKIINEIINGTDNWLNTIKGTDIVDNKNIVENWFTGTKGISNFLKGPIGFESFLQFKLTAVAGTEGYNVFILPIFLDLLINWIFVIGILIFIFIFIILIIKHFKYKKNDKNFKVIEETKTGTDLVWKNDNDKILTRTEALKLTNEELKKLHLQKVKGKNGYYIRSIADKDKNNNLDK